MAAPEPRSTTMPDTADGRRRRQRWVIRGLLLSISLLLGLLLGEVLTRVLFYRSMDFDMEFWKYATQIKSPASDPLLSHQHRTDRRAFLMGVDVSTNHLGFRGNETTLKKPADTYRIVCLGDSLTFGWGVSQDQTFCAQLERLLNANPPSTPPSRVHYEVLNLGVGNYNTVQEVESLRTLGLQLDPDLVLLGYFINDAEPISEPAPGFFVEHSYLYALIASRTRRLPFRRSPVGSYKDYYRNLYRPDQPGWLAAQSALADLAAIGKAKHIPTVMYILPELHDLSPSYPFLEVDHTLALIGARLRMPVIDLFPALQGYSPEANLWVSPGDAHPNALAHSILARAMYKSLADGVLKPVGP